MENTGNTDKAIILLIAQDHIKIPDKMYKVLSDLMKNDLFGLMGDEWSISKVAEEKPHIHEVLNQLAFLMSGDVIAHRHAKQILQMAWETHHYAWDIGWYLKDSNILEEKDGNELDEILAQVFAKNEKAVNDIKGGKDKAVGSLIGQVMRLSQGKADPKTISKRILELLKT
jgi:aspartyl-tRNA(Asn)/glutamyl-tRNA(Gln) amidotransferase subunit B